MSLFLTAFIEQAPDVFMKESWRSHQQALLVCAFDYWSVGLTECYRNPRRIWNSQSCLLSGPFSQS